MYPGCSFYLVQDRGAVASVDQDRFCSVLMMEMGCVSLNFWKEVDSWDQTRYCGFQIIKLRPTRVLIFEATLSVR